MKIKLFLVLLSVCSGYMVQAAKVDTLQIRSVSMGKEVQTVVILPNKAATQFCPVIYLLHGYSGSAPTWMGIKPDLPAIADAKGIIFVCPDGKNSWYWDSPLVPGYKYEIFVSSELVGYIDTSYHTIRNKKGRAITGLSMGGHGALWNAFRHKEVFGAAGSTSGGVDIRPFPDNWEMSIQLGEQTKYPQNWEEYTVINQIHLLNKGDLALIIDCGEDDFFLEGNQEFHRKLLEKGIDHDFITRPGGHDNSYWNNSIDYQILFFEKYFYKN